MTSRLRDLAGMVILAALYVGVATLGLRLDAVGGFATLVWPPTGISLVALAVLGYRMWPGVAIGALVANLGAGAPLAVALGIAAGNTLEAVVGARLLRAAGFRPALERVRDVLVLVVLAALLSPLVSASVGVASLVFGGVLAPGGAPAAWGAWWLGDAMGDLVVAPALFGVAFALRAPVARRRLGEASLLAAALVAIGWVIFGGWHAAALAGIRQSYLVFPLLIWAALRFGARGAAYATLLTSAIAIAGTALGHGPFAGDRLADSLFALQAFMAIVAITVLTLGAVSAERDEAVHRREELLEVVSHELKNPLSALHVSAEVLVAKLPRDDERLRKRAITVQRSADRMTALIQNLLDLSAFEAGRLAVQLADIDVRELVDDVVEMMRPLAVDKRQTIEVALPGDAGRIRCDRERTIQVVANLLANAIKFSPPDSAIGVTVALEAQRVRLSVRDHGPGLSAVERSHVFERYWRAHRDGPRGSGLGLFISQGLVLAQHGAIWVDSAPGAGSTFHVALPRA